MSELDDIRNRIKKRSGNDKPLNDNNFKYFYNFMVKFMVVILVGLVSLSYVKMNPNSDLKKMILNDSNYQKVSTWISEQLLSYLPTDQITVSSEVKYTNVKDNYYKNDSNEVLSINSGKVIDTGNDDNLKGYVVVLGEDEVMITYSGIDNIMVTLYDEVSQGMILGSYEDKFILQFEYLGKEIDYEEYQGME